MGSGPSVLQNEPGFVDAHEVVIRINNYKLVDERTGRRTDIYYSFFGTSIKKTALELRHNGVKLCYAKCPDALAIESEWHRAHGKMNGVDFRYIYRHRAHWWFCDTYITPLEDFLCHFRLLGNHVPTTGFSAILDVLSYAPRSVYLTGFDFFRSGLHNVNERWKAKNNGDPICHVPERELAWLRARVKSYPIICDQALLTILGEQ